jgi:hypothetical protein
MELKSSSKSSSGLILTTRTRTKRVALSSNPPNPVLPNQCWADRSIVTIYQPHKSRYINISVKVKGILRALQDYEFGLHPTLECLHYTHTHTHTHRYIYGYQCLFLITT